MQLHVAASSVDPHLVGRLDLVFLGVMPWDRLICQAFVLQCQLDTPYERTEGAVRILSD